MLDASLAALAAQESPNAPITEGEVNFLGPIVSEGLRARYEELGIPAVSGHWFARQLNEVEGDDIRVRINSPGGQVGEGAVIADRMREAQNAGRRIHAHVDVAASAASWVPLTADSSSMSDLGRIYVHRPMMPILGVFYSDQLDEMSSELRNLEPHLARVMDGRPVNYAAMGVRSAVDLMSGKTGNGTTIYKDVAVEANFIDGAEAPSSENAEAAPASTASLGAGRTNDLRLRMRLHEWSISNELSR